MRVARRTFALSFALALGFGVIHGCGDDVTPAPPDNGEFGSLVNAEEFANASQALPPAALQDPPGPSPVPSTVTLANLPAIAMQGTDKALGAPGSCEGQSFGYALGSYTAARAPDGSIKWAANNPGNEVSAAYQFALAINNGFAKCSGGLATPYLGRLSSFGSPSTAEVPYEPSCTYFAGIDLNKPYPSATRLRIGSFATFEIEQNGGIARIKEYLSSGQAVAFSGSVYNGYGSAGGPPLTDGYFYAGNLGSSGGHGQMVVGYDDSLGATNMAKGMLLIQNSFGTNWPASDSRAPRGMLYWSYETFLKTQKLAAVAYPYDPAPPSGTMLTSNDAKAPVAAIKRAYQWAPSAGGGDVWLVLIHHVAEPVRITQIAMSEPTPGKGTAIGHYGQFLSSGYTYLRRADGKAFLPGAYQVKYQAQTLDGQAVAYTGTVTVGTPLPLAPEAASMTVAKNVFDSTGKAALVTP